MLTAHVRVFYFRGMRFNLLEAFLSSHKVCTDTRQIEPGAIFFALKGGNFDGNTTCSRKRDSLMPDEEMLESADEGEVLS